MSDATNKNFSMDDIKRMASSEAGRKLFQLLQQQNPQQLNNAMEQAAAKDYDAAKNTLSSLLSSDQVRQLLKQMGGSSHG